MISDNEQIINRQRSLMDIIAQTHRIEDQNAFFKSHDGMDLDPTTPGVDSCFDFNRKEQERY